MAQMRKTNHGSKDKNAPSHVKTKNNKLRNGKPRGGKTNPAQAPNQDYRVAAGADGNGTAPPESPRGTF